MKTIYLGLVIMVLMTIASASHAATSLAPQERHVLMTETFRTVTRTEDLPESVKQEFARVSGTGTFKMADPDQDFQVTDVVMKEGLPFRRLVFAGLSTHYCVLHYEHGGIGYGTDLVLFKITGDHAQYLWHGCATRTMLNIKELRKDIQGHRFDDSLDYCL